MADHAAGAGESLAIDLDRLRTGAGLSFRDLSRLTGQPVSTLHNALRGRVFPRLNTVVSIVRACGQDDGPWRERWADLAQGPAAPDLPGKPGREPGQVVPRELPRAPRAFAGRARELDRLTALVDHETELEAEHGVGIVAIYGMPGVGKTAFAVQAAHQLSGRFPDGQLFVDLRGHRPGAAPMTAAEALPSMLRSLGAAQESVPAALDARIRLYRTMVSRRRVLVVLDDALDAEQVRALVPGGAGGMVIVTSRHRLDGMVALDGAHAFHLDVLTEAESRAMLTNLVDEYDTAAFDELARLCGHLPLALRVAAANVAVGPHTGLAEAVAELSGDPMARLRMPADRRVAVQAAFTASYRLLSAVSASLLRRFGTVPCGQFTVDGAAALLGTAPHAAQAALDELEAGCLVEQRALRRYGVHDLIRRYAADRADEEDREAFGGLMEWYRRTADAAARMLYPEMLRLPAGDDRPAGVFDATDDALAWLDAEIDNLVAVMAHAAVLPHPPASAWSLADSLRGYFVLRFRLEEWLRTAESGLRVAQWHGDRLGQGAMHHSLGVAQSRNGDNAAADRHLTSALGLYRAAGWAEGTCAILICLGGSYFHEGRLDEATAALEEAIDIATRHDLPARKAAALGDLGEVCRDRGLLHRAREHQIRTARCCQELGMARGHAIALLCLGLACVELGELADAQRHLSEAHKRCLALGSRDGEAYAELGLAATALETGALGQARDRAGKAHALASAIAEESLVIEASLVRAEALRRLGQPSAALAEARQASRLATERNYLRGIPRSLIVLAEAERAEGRAAEARADCLRALDLSRQHGYQVTAGRALTLLAALDQDQGLPEPATRHAEQALDIHRRTGHRVGEAATLMLLGRLCELAGRQEAARRHRREGSAILAGLTLA